MKEYLVTVKRVVTDKISVQAESKSAASKIAKRFSANFCETNPSLYSELAERVDVTYADIDLINDIELAPDEDNDESNSTST